MTRLWVVVAGLLGLVGIASGQTMVEGALGAGAAATGASGARGIGKSVGGIAGALDNALKPAAANATENPSISTSKSRNTSDEAPPRATLADPVRSYEDPAGIQVGMGSDELLRRFGPAQLDMMGTDVGRMLTYRANSGVYQLEVKNNKVNRISVMSRHQTAMVLPSHGSEER